MARIKEIIEKYFAQPFDKRIRNLFVEWLTASVDSDLKDNLLQEQWEKEYYMAPEEVDKSYKAVMKKIGRSRLHPIRKYLPLGWAVAASLAAVVLSCMLLYLQPQRQDEVQELISERMTECYVPDGEKQVITLSDSTVVILNSGSLLIYPEKFGTHERKVYLTGEAIFDVSKDAEHPFIVKTPDFSIRVLGTLFNVCSYPDEEYATATLREGSISISANGKDAWLLSPNQTLSYVRESQKVTVEQADAEEAFAWKDGRLCFKYASIHQIVRSIERYYGIRVYLTTGKYDKERITAKFIHGESIDELFSTLSLILPGMKYDVENDSVYIR